MKKIICVLCLVVTAGCQNTQPTVVNVNYEEQEQGGYRSPEKLRNLWVAPVASGDVLQHEQLITYVDKAVQWQIPTTIEPNAVSSPELPRQEGEYDETVLERHRQLLDAERKKSKELESQITKVKGDAEISLNEKNQIITEMQKQQQSTALQLNALAKQVEEDRKANEERAAKEKAEKSKPWYKRIF